MEIAIEELNKCVFVKDTRRLKKERTNKRASKSTTTEKGAEEKSVTTALEEKAKQTNSFKNQYCKAKNKVII